MKQFKYILIIILMIGLLGFGMLYYAKNNLFLGSNVVESSTVVLEKINKVMKLVTVEGQFSEITKHEEWYGYNISPLRKKALIRINAKVLVGYDLEKMDLELDEKSKTVYIKSFPNAEILSLDDDIEYYDISEGLFTSFSKEDYTSIQKKGEMKIRSIAMESGLLEKADEQKSDMLAILQLTLQAIGWELKVDQDLPTFKKD